MTGIADRFPIGNAKWAMRNGFSELRSRFNLEIASVEGGSKCSKFASSLIRCANRSAFPLSLLLSKRPFH